MNIGIIGSGEVGTTLGAGFLSHGYGVMIGTRDPSKLSEWVAANPGAQVGSSADAAHFGEAIVLAVKGTAALDALKLAGTEALAGKTVMDTTNPLSEMPPVNGVLHSFTDLNSSLMERLQSEYPRANFVKVFNSVGSAKMVNPNYSAGRPTMFICGRDASSKKFVSEVLDAFGWEALDMGNVEAARAIEPLAVLWCIRGFLNDEWTHAFKVLHS